MDRSPFGNDSAVGWLDDLVGGGLAVLVDTVSDVADLADVEEVDVDRGRRAVAGAAVVAACLDGQRSGLPAAAVAWLDGETHAIPSHLARKAGRALERILRDSDLQAEWQGTPEHAAWVGETEALRARLP